MVAPVLEEIAARARRQADDRQAQHRREPRDRPRLPGHVDPDDDRVPGRQAGQEHRRRQAQGRHPARPHRLPAERRPPRPATARTLAAGPLPGPSGRAAPSVTAGPPSARTGGHRRVRAPAADPRASRRRRGRQSADDGQRRRMHAAAAAATAARPSPRSQAVLRGLGLLDDARPRTADGAASYDQATELAVRHFQQSRGLSVDGLVGEETYRALNEARWRLGDRVLRFDPDRPVRGDDVTGLQDRLLELGYDAGPADGVFGPGTETGLRAFQRDYGLIADGTCGPATLRALRQLGRKVVGGRPSCCGRAPRWSRAARTCSASGSSSTPATAAPTPATPPGETTEADLVFDLATRLEGRLAAAGATVYLTRGRGQDPSARRADGVRQRRRRRPGHLPARRRARLAARPRGGHLLLRHRLGGVLDRRRAARRPGPARAGGPHRPARPAARHAKTWDLLRMTRMPAVRLDCGYLSHPVDRLLLLDPGCATPSRRPSWPPSSGCSCPPRPTRRPARSSCPPRLSWGGWGAMDPDRSVPPPCPASGRVALPTLVEVALPPGPHPHGPAPARPRPRGTRGWTPWPTGTPHAPTG